MPKIAGSRGAQGDGTIRKRRDGRWEARFTVGMDPGTGKQIQKSIYGRTQAEVRKKLKEKTNEVDNGDYTEPSKLTVGAWLDLWIKEFVVNVKASTIEQYQYQIETHLKPGIGAVKLSELSVPLVQKLYNRLGRPHKIRQKRMNGKTVTLEKQGLSPKSIRNMNSVLHEALDKAVKLGYIRTNACDAVTLPRVQKREMNPIKDDKIRTFLEVIRDHPYRDVFYVTMFTGMREGEILGLTWDCIDFEKSMITIYRQLQKERVRNGRYRFVSLKNDKQRSFMAAKSVMDVLRKIRLQQAENRLKVGDMWENDEGFVFTNEFGKHLSKATVYENFKRCAAAAGIPATRFHDLRHTYATLALEQKVDVKTVSSNLGHATVAFTLDVYGHVSEQMQLDSAEKMQNYLKAL